MISNKKSYAMRMLQLALALSLLHVDPDDYLHQRLRAWDSQLELRDGDGWELEMLRAVPMVEYPYANRKTMMPLIEDLVHFDRQVDAHAAQYNVTAYLLNVQSDSANQTAALQEMQALPNTASNTPAAGAAGGGGAPLEQVSAAAVTVTATASTNASTLGFPSPDLELFLNSEHFQDSRSVWEQNLADLNDFGDLPILNPYAHLPFKDGQQDASWFDMHLDIFLPSFGSSAASEADVAGAVALNDTFHSPDDMAAIKLEKVDDQDDKVAVASELDNVASCSTASTSGGGGGDAGAGSGATAITVLKNESCIKKEEEEEEEEQKKKVEGEGAASEPELDLSPFISQVEFTKEESEIVEVLWKQDVDLGYSLTPAHLLGSDDANDGGVGAGAAAGAKHSSSVTDDDIEKLKALEELKLENPKFDSKDEGNEGEELGNEWDGIPFTIDNETGEYIRLPLDEIINDVLQFAELAGESNENNGDDSNGDGDDVGSVATTSKAATTSNDNNNKKHHKGHTNEDNGEERGNNFSDINAADDKSVSEQLKVEGELPFSDTNERNTDDSLTDVVKPSADADVDANGNFNDAGDDLSQSEIEVGSLPSPLFDLDDEARKELEDFDMMLQSSAPFPHHHPHHHHHHPHRVATAGGGAAAAQNYAVASGMNSAFHRQATSAGFPPHGHHQGRMPLSRGVSMEQRLQDIASLFNPIPSMGVVGGVSEMAPYPHYPTTHHYSYQGAPQHAQYPPPPPPPPAPHTHAHAHHHAAMLHPNAALGDMCNNQPHYGHNLGSAVSSSMHLTNASHETDVAGATAGIGAIGGAPNNVGPYKMEHDMMQYYSNASSDMNHTTDGLFNSILNDEDLHLMDMNVNDSFCRMVDVNNSTSNNSSVLGLSSSGHASAGTGGTSSGSSVGGISMSGNAGAAPGGAAGGMTADLMGSAAQGADRLDASSDSAVSSMGSERVPSLSDGEWGEGSDSAQDYHQGKYGGPYDYSYNNNANANGNGNGNGNANRLNDGTRQPPVAQKKHHMFGKRFLNEQPGVGGGGTGPVTGSTAATTVAATAAAAAVAANVGLHGSTQSIKYEYEPYPAVAGLHQSMSSGGSIESGAMGPALSKEHHAYGGAYSLDFSLRTPRTPHEIIQHNHTYALPQGTGSLPRPQQRDKKTSTSSSKSAKSGSNGGSGAEDDGYMTRDEKRARALNIPIPVTDIINLPMDEFNERLSKYDLSENQLTLIRDIRRRGKNKVAAQNCRKRKLDQILSLEDEVKQVRRRKEELQQQREHLMAERKRVSNKFSALHRHIFQYLRDPEGNPCSPSEYSLQQAADGSIYLLPRDATNKNDASSGVGALGANGGGGHGGGVAPQPPPSHSHSHPQHTQLSGGQQHHALVQNSQQQQQQHTAATLRQSQAQQHHGTTHIQQAATQPTPPTQQPHHHQQQQQQPQQQHQHQTHASPHQQKD